MFADREVEGTGIRFANCLWLVSGKRVDNKMLLRKPRLRILEVFLLLLLITNIIHQKNEPRNVLGGCSVNKFCHHGSGVGSDLCQNFVLKKFQGLAPRVC